MDKKTVNIITVVLFVVGLIGGTMLIKTLKQPPEPSEQTKSLIGTPLPEFSLYALDNVKENINQWRDKVRVINFWGTWCEPCVREIPALIDLQERYRGQGLEVIGIAVDNPSAVREYAEEKKINYTILIGREAIKISKLLGNDAELLPYTVVIDLHGNFSYIKYGEADPLVLEEEIKALL